MLSSSKVRPCLFVAQKCQTPGDLQRVIGLIEKHGRDIRNRTHLNPEAGHGSKSFPLRILPHENGLVLHSISSIEGVLSVDFVKAMTGDFLEALQNKSLNLKSTSLEIKLYSRQIPLRNLRAQLSFADGRWSVGYAFYEHPQDLPEAENCLRRVIEIGALPISVRVKDSKFWFSHTTAAGDLITRSKVKGNKFELPAPASVTDFGATFPDATRDEVVSRFKSIVQNRAFRARDGKWFFHFPDWPARQEQHAAEMLEKFNELGMSGDKGYSYYFWHLKHYRDFERMPDMADEVSWTAAQSLLDFEFGDGKRCQADILCHQREKKFRLFLSFDKREDGAEVSNLLGIKLKPRE